MPQSRSGTSRRPMPERSRPSGTSTSSVGPGEVFGLLGPERRREVDDGRHAHDDGRARAPGTAGWPASTSSDAARRPGRSSSVVFQEPASTGRSAGGETSRSTPAYGGCRRPTRGGASTRRPTALGLTDLLDRPVGTYSGGERRRLEIARALVSQPRCCSSTSPRSASTRASAPSCSTSSPGCAIGGRRRSCSPRTTSTRPSASATGSRSCTRGASSPSTRRPRCSPSSASRSSSCASTSDAGRGARPRSARAASPATTRSRSARPSPSRFTTDPSHA